MVEALRPYFGIVLEGGLSLLLGLANGVLLFVLALFIAFFFYLYGDPISARLRVILQRIAGARAERLIDVTGATVRGVVYGILLTAIVQGMLTAFGLWLSGVPRPVLLGAVAGFLSVLPIGAPVVWIPAALWLMSSGHLGWGIFLAVYGVVAVSGADSVIRPWFIARGAQLPVPADGARRAGRRDRFRPARDLPRSGAAGDRLYAGQRVVRGRGGNDARSLRGSP